MRSAAIFTAIAGLAAAGPVVSRGQSGLDLSAFLEADSSSLPTGPPIGASSDTVPYDQAKNKQVAAAQTLDDLKTADASGDSKLSARQFSPASSCGALQPDGKGPVPGDGSYGAFMADKQWSTLAGSNTKPPTNYVLSFTDLSGSVEGPGYRGLKTLTGYNVDQCAKYCDAAKDCYGFNIFVERDPKYAPTDSCLNPEPITNYKCTLWGVPVKTATNLGQYRRDFRVGIRASNGYSKVTAPASQPGYSGPVAFVGAINAPDDSYFGVKFFPGSFDPALCATACTTTTTYNREHPKSDNTYDTCAFFNAYIINQNGIAQGTSCTLYTKAWGTDYAVNYGQTRGSDVYTVTNSYGYTLQAN